MTSVSWETLGGGSADAATVPPSPEALEQFLWSADLVNVSQPAERLIIKRALLNCASAPSLERTRGVQCRVFQLLQELNFDPTADDASLLFGSVFQSLIKNWLPHADVLGVALTVLATVSRKASFGLQLDYPFFLTALSKILEQYLWNITIQKASLQLVLSALSSVPNTLVGGADVLVDPLLNCIEINSSPESIEILRIYVQAAKQSSTEVPKREKIISTLKGVLEASTPPTLPETKAALGFVLEGLQLPVSSSKTKRVTIVESSCTSPAPSSTPPPGAMRSIRGGKKATPAAAVQPSLPLPTPPPSPSPTSTPAPPTPVPPPPRTPVAKSRAAASPATTNTTTTTSTTKTTTTTMAAATPVQTAKSQQQISPIPQKSSPGSTPKQKQQQDPKQQQHPGSATPRGSPAIKVKPVLSLKAQGRVIARKSPQAGSLSPSPSPSPLPLDLPSPSPSPRFKINPKHLVDITRLSQQQAVAAINRAELIQTLFLDAAKKMESLLLENSTLRASLEQAEKKREGRDSGEHRLKKGPDSTNTSSGGGSASSWVEKSQNLAVEGLTAALQRIKSSRARTQAKLLPTRERFNTSVTVETMEQCAAGLCSLFARQVPTASGSISISALRKCVSLLGLTPCSRGPATLQKSSLDLIISSSSMAMSRGHIQSHVSLDQVSFILLCCVGEAKRFQSAHGQQLVETLSKALAASAVPTALEKKGSLQDLAEDDEMLRLLLSSATVRLVYSKYLRGATAAAVQSTPSSLTSPYKGNPSAVATDGLLPIEAIVTLCRDAKICPNFVSFSCVESLCWEVIRKSSANSAPVLTPRQFAIFLVNLSARLPQFRQDDDRATGEAERRANNLEELLASCRL